MRTELPNNTKLVKIASKKEKIHYYLSYEYRYNYLFNKKTNIYIENNYYKRILHHDPSRIRLSRLIHYSKINQCNQQVKFTKITCSYDTVEQKHLTSSAHFHEGSKPPQQTGIEENLLSFPL